MADENTKGTTSSATVVAGYQTRTSGADVNKPRRRAINQSVADIRIGKATARADVSIPALTAPILFAVGTCHNDKSPETPTTKAIAVATAAAAALSERQDDSGHAEHHPQH